MPRGGKRPGAGRKVSPNTLDKVMARELLRQMVIKELPALVNAQMASAKGLNVAVIRRPDGTFKRIDSPEAFDAAVDSGAIIDVHTLQPSVQAFTDLMNRALDKPAESVALEHSGSISISIDAPWLSKK